MQSPCTPLLNTNMASSSEYSPRCGPAGLKTFKWANSQEQYQVQEVYEDAQSSPLLMLCYMGFYHVTV